MDLIMAASTTQISERTENNRIREKDSADKIAAQQQNSSILSKISSKDKSAVKDCVEKYGTAVWLISKKFTDSPGEAEKLTCEIFSELWENIENFDCSKTNDDYFIMMIALKCVKKYQKNLI